jgi:MATE family multidrug resistance protein
MLHNIQPGIPALDSLVSIISNKKDVDRGFTRKTVEKQIDVEIVDEPATLKQFAKSSIINVWEMLKIAIPVLIIYVSFIAMDLTDIIFLGRLEDGKYLAGATLASALSLVVMTVPFGMIGAQDTIVSQAFGAENKRVMKIVLYRSILLTCVVFIPVYGLLGLSKYLFATIVKHEEAEVAEHAATYMYFSLPGLLPFAIFRVLSSYLISQDTLFIPCTIGLITLGFNVFMNFLLVHGLGEEQGLGFIGSPLATSVARITSLILILVALSVRHIFFRFRKAKKNEKPTQKWTIWETIKAVIAWQGLKEYIYLAVPSIFVLLMDYGCFEIISFVSAQFGEQYVSAHAILMNISLFTYSLPNSISTAVGVRVGYMLGSKQPKKAKWVSWVSICMGIFVMAICSTIVASCREYIADIFTPDNHEVKEIVVQVLPVVAVFQVFDGAQLVSGGVLRGMGMQKICVLTSFFGFYVIGLPAGAMMAFIADWKLMGFWIGLAAALGTVAVVLLTFIILWVKWDRESEKATSRVEQQAKEEPAVSDIMIIAEDIELQWPFESPLPQESQDNFEDEKPDDETEDTVATEDYEIYDSKAGIVYDVLAI